MATIDENYEGHKDWTAWSRQEIIADEGETLHEVVEFMRSHLQHFSRTDLTFDTGEIQRKGNRYYIILRPVDGPPAYVHFGKNLEASRFQGRWFDYPASSESTDTDQLK
ncbi:hypothetical protein [Dyadobacter sp. CY326]|uniref:hypothetical protein n=1 Tax=Dyadobacter sp. CY326 TaxID=2907300 RepID=UPI001F23BDA4|nr:hypothetical protein [Dyadobacter sp. CY326]MCE7065801.1 hypothetical protein [Dyadobacter sp. CY326]